MLVELSQRVVRHLANRAALLVNLVWGHGRGRTGLQAETQGDHQRHYEGTEYMHGSSPNLFGCCGEARLLPPVVAYSGQRSLDFPTMRFKGVDPLGADK
ncbi:hypothetical protein BN874_770093 [Candidatus Contendobacter odensis Run_B_J11]|uniref:Uncharacterized protein n=1 Tax=Candidatus Contendobacter odensis Run_B_J11 TaxID=1400861 RepID=A0A7U7J626_9GAMM|nr:hypothetical protein BN874_770093 [Candidatus Contendobacter odensis Run_B_J11]